MILTQTAPIAELAVVSKEELVTLGFTQHMELLSHEIPLTEKKLTVEASFRMKADSTCASRSGSGSTARRGGSRRRCPRRKSSPWSRSAS